MRYPFHLTLVCYTMGLAFLDSHIVKDISVHFITLQVKGTRPFLIFLFMLC